MTLPASGPISMSQVNTELLISPSTTTITMNDSGVRFLTGTSAGTTDSMQQLLGKSYVIAANSGILTSGSSYTLPQTSGTTIKVLAIAGGGGGGGGSGRNAANAGFNTGAGGGAAGGNAYATVTVTPGATVSFSIGGAGTAGDYRMGVYAPAGSAGGTGGSTSITVNGTVVASVTAAGGGALCPDPTGGTAGGASTGTQYLSPNAGGTGTQTNQFTGQGGLGAAGYTISTTVGAALSSIIGYGSTGATYVAGGAASQSGTVYGAGGGGGGTNQSDQQSYQNMFAAAGTTGAVFIWWGY